MPAGPSRSPRKSGSLATKRTQSRRIVSATPIVGTRSRRISKRAAEADDARAREHERLIMQRLGRLGLPTEGETPASLGALLRQRDCDPFGGVFDDDHFGGFADTSMGMDDDYNGGWYSEEELEDETEDELPSTQKTDHAIKTETEVNNWTKFIDIVTGDTVTQESSSFCTCNKSTRSIPIVSLSTGVLNCNWLLTMKDMSTWTFKSAGRIALFVRVCSISSVKVIFRRLPSNLDLRSRWMFFLFSTGCT